MSILLRQPTRGAFAEMAATGTTQATAAEITADYVVVTPTTDATGVVLPPGNLNDEVIIVNASASENLVVYPRSGGKLNRASADASLEILPRTAAHFRGENSLNWAAFF